MPSKTSASTQKTSIRPLASICLSIVKGWIAVVRSGRGGQIDDQGTAWSRIPANQLQEQLSREFQVEVSTRSVQRALKELEEANLLRRQQRLKHRYRRDYWYAATPTEEALHAQHPRTIRSNYQHQQQSQRRRQAVPTEATPRTHQVLSTPISNTQISKPAAPNPKPSTGKRTIQEALRNCVERATTTRTHHPQGFAPEPTTRPTQTPSNAIPRTIQQQGRTYQVLDAPTTAFLR